MQRFEALMGQSIQRTIEEKQEKNGIVGKKKAMRSPIFSFAEAMKGQSKHIENMFYLDRKQN